MTIPGPVNKLLLWGAGGHSKVVLDVARAAGLFHEIAYLDDGGNRRGTSFAGCAIMGGPAEIPSLAAKGFSHLLVCIGDNRARAGCLARGMAAGLQAATLIHPSAVISPSAEIGAGTVVMPRVVVNAFARIGRNCIVNTGAIVEHDCVVGDHVHLAPGSILGGAAAVDAYSFIGTGAVVLPKAHVEEGAVLGAGAVVLRSLEAGVTAVGVPARPRAPRG